MYGMLDMDMAGVKPGARLYLPLSGGLDSSYQGWRLLKAGYPLVIHHCSLEARGKRTRQEDDATEAVLDWYRAQGLDNFDVLYSSVDVQEGIGYRVIDQEVTLWIASLHLRKYTPKNPKPDVDTRQDVQAIVFPNYRTSGVTLGERRFNRAWEMFKLMVQRPITPLQPFYQYDKMTVLQDMPQELFELCWWCRSPKDGKRCGRCKQCRNVNASGRLSS